MYVHSINFVCTYKIMNIIIWYRNVILVYIYHRCYNDDTMSVSCMHAQDSISYYRVLYSSPRSRGAGPKGIIFLML